MERRRRRRRSLRAHPAQKHRRPSPSSVTTAPFGWRGTSTWYMSAVSILLAIRLSHATPPSQLPHWKGLHVPAQEETTDPWEKPGKKSMARKIYLGCGELHIPYFLGGFLPHSCRDQLRKGTALNGMAPNSGYKSLRVTRSAGHPGKNFTWATV